MALTEVELEVMKEEAVAAELEHRDKRKQLHQKFKELRKKARTGELPYNQKQVQGILFMMRRMIQTEAREEVSSAVKFLRKRWEYEEEKGLNKVKTVRQYDEETQKDLDGGTYG